MNIHTPHIHFPAAFLGILDVLMVFKKHTQAASSFDNITVTSEPIGECLSPINKLGDRK